MDPAPEVFGVIWMDFVPLSLTCPDAATAIKTAARIREKAGDKIRDCRAVRVPQGTVKLEYLD